MSILTISQRFYQLMYDNYIKKGYESNKAEYYALYRCAKMIANDEEMTLRFLYLFATTRYRMQFVADDKKYYQFCDMTINRCLHILQDKIIVTELLMTLFNTLPLFCET